MNGRVVTILEDVQLCGDKKTSQIYRLQKAPGRGWSKETQCGPKSAQVWDLHLVTAGSKNSERPHWENSLGTCFPG